MAEVSASSSGMNIKDRMNHLYNHVYTNYDADQLLSYNTPAMVRIRDRRLGLLYYFFLAAIFAYIVAYQIIYNRGYLNLDSPNGYVNLRLLPNPKMQTNQPDFCFGAKDGCKYFDIKLLEPSIDNDDLFVTTKLKVSNRSLFLEGCDEPSFLASDKRCIFDENTIDTKANFNEYFVTDVDDTIVLVEHRLANHMSDKDSFKKMEGELIKFGVDGKAIVLKKFEKDKPTDHYFKISELIDAANKNLDNDQFKLRKSGLQLTISITYTVVDSDGSLFYTLSVKEPITSTFSKTKTLSLIQPQQKSVQLLDLQGIYFTVSLEGRVGRFDFMTLLINLVAGSALLKVATTIVDYLMLWVLPQRLMYRSYKFKDTMDFQDYRLMNLSQEAERSKENKLAPEIVQVVQVTDRSENKSLEEAAEIQSINSFDQDPLSYQIRRRVDTDY